MPLLLNTTNGHRL